MKKIKKYYSFNEKNTKSLHDFISKNVFFAFSQEQFNDGLKKFNIDPENKEEIKNKLHKYIGGGFILIESEKEEKRIIKKRNKVQRKYLSKFKNLVDALKYEMYNHECGYTGDYLNGLYAIGYGLKDLRKNKKLQKAYFKAKTQVHKWFIEHN